jgi:hypothetical protein
MEQKNKEYGALWNKEWLHSTGWTKVRVYKKIAEDLDVGIGAWRKNRKSIQSFSVSLAVEVS